MGWWENFMLDNKMNLNFNIDLAHGYTSNSQIARVLTENWVKMNSYCPNCGQLQLNDFKNNMPVADFYCLGCKEEFELKSKNGKLTSIINDGAYDSMIKRITSETNPNFFFLTYDKNTVNNFLVIPKHFFTPEIIIKRNPLSVTAKRPGWIGCNIDISKVPESGRIFIVENSKIIIVLGFEFRVSGFGFRVSNCEMLLCSLFYVLFSFLEFVLLVHHQKAFSLMGCNHRHTDLFLQLLRKRIRTPRQR